MFGIDPGQSLLAWPPASRSSCCGDKMDRFLVKAAVGGLKRRMDQEQTGGGPAGLAEEEGNSKKSVERV